MNLGKLLSSMIKPELEELKEICNFTDEEENIISMLKNKRTNVEIAQKLNISVATLDRREKAIREKIERSNLKMDKKIPTWEKMNLTIEEAAEYSSIGICKLQEMTKQANCPFVLYVGKKKLIKRKLFEKFIETTVEL